MEPVMRLRVMLNTRSSLNMPGTFGSGPLCGGNIRLCPGNRHVHVHVGNSWSVSLAARRLRAAHCCNGVLIPYPTRSLQESQAGLT